MSHQTKENTCCSKCASEVRLCKDTGCTDCHSQEKKEEETECSGCSATHKKIDNCECRMKRCQNCADAVFSCISSIDIMPNQDEKKWTCPCGKPAEDFDLCGSAECKEKYTYTDEKEEEICGEHVSGNNPPMKTGHACFNKKPCPVHNPLPPTKEEECDCWRTGENCSRCPPAKEVDLEEADRELENLFNIAVGLCLKQIRSEITEEDRKEAMEGLDKKGKAILRNLLSSSQNTWKREIEKVLDYTEHKIGCILNTFSAGRPTEDGGYEQKFGNKWYEAKPIDKTPNCDCGLDAVLLLINRKK